MFPFSVAELFHSSCGLNGKLVTLANVSYAVRWIVPVEPSVSSWSLIYGNYLRCFRIKTIPQVNTMIIPPQRLPSFHNNLHARKSLLHTPRLTAMSLQPHPWCVPRGAFWARLRGSFLGSAKNLPLPHRLLSSPSQNQNHLRIPSPSRTSSLAHPPSPRGRSRMWHSQSSTRSRPTIGRFSRAWASAPR